EHLARDWPELVPSYLALYRRPYPDRATTEPVKSMVATLKKRFDIADRRARALQPRPAAEQLALAICRRLHRVTLGGARRVGYHRRIIHIEIPHETVRRLWG